MSCFAQRRTQAGFSTQLVAFHWTGEGLKTIQLPKPKEADHEGEFKEVDEMDFMD